MNSTFRNVNSHFSKTPTNTDIDIITDLKQQKPNKLMLPKICNDSCYVCDSCSKIKAGRQDTRLVFMNKNKLTHNKNHHIARDTKKTREKILTENLAGPSNDSQVENNLLQSHGHKNNSKTLAEIGITDNIEYIQHGKSTRTVITLKHNTAGENSALPKILSPRRRFSVERASCPDGTRRHDDQEGLSTGSKKFNSLRHKQPPPTFRLNNISHQLKNSGHQSENTVDQLNNTKNQSENISHELEKTSHQSDNTGYQSENKNQLSGNTGDQSNNTKNQSENISHKSENTTHQSDNIGHQLENIGHQSENKGYPLRNTSHQSPQRSRFWLKSKTHITTRHGEAETICSDSKQSSPKDHLQSDPQHSLQNGHVLKESQNVLGSHSVTRSSQPAPDNQDTPSGDVQDTRSDNVLHQILEDSHSTRRSSFEIDDDKKQQLCTFLEADMYGSGLVLQTPFGSKRMVYLDYVASGRPLKSFEHFLQHHVMPTYSNTHTEVNFVSQQTSHFRHEARSIIKECVNASSKDAVIFTGSGTTAAINKLIYALDIYNKSGVTVFVGPYEHHSNILPWREIKANVITVPQTDQGHIDLKFLKRQLKKCRCAPRRTLIGSFSAASNVTGIMTDVDAVATLMHNYGGYAFFDYACAAPYTDIDMNPPKPGAYKDAVFISPHKFIGGPQTPGILVAKHWLFRNPVPHGVGGGTVVFVRRRSHKYVSDLEEREEGGTPAIIESIRAGLVFKLKAAFGSEFIIDREKQKLQQAKAAWSSLPGLIILGNLEVDRLPIFSMLFLDRATGRLLHHNFVARVLNDVFGIQVRSGCACAGPYGMGLLGITEKLAKRYETLILKQEKNALGGQQSTQMRDQPRGQAHNLMFKPGFVRLNFPYFVSKECVQFVLKSIEMTSRQAWLLLPLYEFNLDTGTWCHQAQPVTQFADSLKNVTFKSGQFDVEGQPGNQNKSSDIDFTAASPHTETSEYEGTLQRAEIIFREARNASLGLSLPRVEMTKEEESLRWFMLPYEAVDIINGRPVKHLEPTHLPFLPTCLRHGEQTDQSSRR